MMNESLYIYLKWEKNFLTWELHRRHMEKLLSNRHDQ